VYSFAPGSGLAMRRRACHIDSISGVISEYLVAGRWRPRSWRWCRACCPARWSGDGLGWWSASGTRGGCPGSAPCWRLLHL
jgi:hypothetical protein